MNFPDNLRYTKDHEWIKYENGTATVGITAFAASELGDVVYVDITTEGKTLNADEIFGTVEAVKTVSDLFLPVAGTVSAVNSALSDRPELVNADPYGEGWMIRLQVDNVTDIDSLMSAEDYQKLIS